MRHNTTAARIVELLKDENLTGKQLAAEMNVTERTVQRHIARLLSEERRRIYIVEWILHFGRIGCRPEALYRIGSRKDAAKPTTTYVEASRRYRKKWEATMTMRRASKKGPINPFHQLLVAAR